MRKMLCFTLAAVVVSVNTLIFPDVAVSVEAESNVQAAEAEEDKVYCYATVDENFEEGVVLVGLTKTISATNHLYTAEEFSEMFGVEIVEAVPIFYIERGSGANVDWDSYRQIYKLTIPQIGKQAVLDVIDIIEQHPYVWTAEPNYIEIFKMPELDVTSLSGETGQIETESLGEQLSATTSITNDTNIGEQYAVEMMDLLSAWNFSTGNANVVVGVIDTGIDGAHPDLINNLHPTLGADFVGDGVSCWEDQVGHGTHVAGIIGAEGNNGIGVAGVCWDVSLVSLRTLRKGYDEDGFVVGKGSRDALVLAIQYATEHNIPILNCSNGSYNSYYGLLYSTIDAYPGLLICSAGNNKCDTDVTPHYPSCYDLPNVLSIAACSKFDGHSTYTNWGETTVDFAAPGDRIYSTFPTVLCASAEHDMLPGSHSDEAGYHYMYGTSMAAPQVAGVAALLLSYYPNLTAEELKFYILNSLDPINATHGKNTATNGRLNAAKAFALANDYQGAIDGRYVAGDFDGDGKDDVACMADLGGKCGQIRVSLSTGTAAAPWAIWFESKAFLPSMIGSRLVAGDFNGDGKDDIAAFCDHSTVVDANRGTMYVFLSTGTAFGTWPQIWYQSDYFLATTVNGRMVAGDFNGDGKDDISCMIDYSFYMPEGNSRIVTFISTGSAFTNQTWFDTSAFPAQYVTDRFTAGDFNGDGKDDIACLFDYSFQQSGKSTMFVFVSTGSSFGSWPQTWFATDTACPAGKVTGRFTAGDFTGDGKDDVAMMFDYSYYQPEGTSTTFVFVSTGSSFGSWPQSWFITEAFPASPVTHRFEAGDMNGDGKADIAAMYAYLPESELLGTQFVFVSAGTSFGSWPQTWLTGPTTSPYGTAQVTATAQAQLIGDMQVVSPTGTQVLDAEESFRLHCERMGLC